MKFVFDIPIVLALAAVLVGCGGGDPDEMKRELSASISTKKAKSPQEYYNMSVDLAGMNGCMNCHRIDQDLIGPSWSSISAHYKNDPNAREWLINKVKNGGAGVWSATTSGAAMPPNSPRVSDKDIGELVDFILSLNKSAVQSFRGATAAPPRTQ